MQGIVMGLQATLKVPFVLSDEQYFQIEFVVDTGFEGALTLPQSAVEALALPFFEPVSANLADNTTVTLPSYVAVILWQELEVEVIVLSTGQRPLLGTALLDRKRLCIDFDDGGSVNVTDLSGVE